MHHKINGYSRASLKPKEPVLSKYHSPVRATGSRAQQRDIRSPVLVMSAIFNPQNLATADIFHEHCHVTLSYPLLHLVFRKLTGTTAGLCMHIQSQNVLNTLAPNRGLTEQVLFGNTWSVMHSVLGTDRAFTCTANSRPHD